ncbi:MAG: hypothetical protein PUD80_04320 [Firmicutes bacterium]|nr:hypothetical protein [Bacillota bacterium]
MKKEAIVNRAAADGQTAIIGAWGAAPSPGEQELVYVTLPYGQRLRNLQIAVVEYSI